MSWSFGLLSIRIANALVDVVRTTRALKRPRSLFRFYQAVAGSFLIPAVLVVPLLAQPAGAGVLDPSFGTNGVVTTDLGGSDEARALAVQRDGKIVAAGMTGVGGRIDFALARYNADGSLDGTFGDGGMVTTGFGAVDIARAIALQTDDKIVVAGSSAAYPKSNFALARYDVSGHLDPSFGDSGIVVTGFGVMDSAQDLVIQPDGKIVAVGSSCAGSTCSIALARYNTDGSLDESSFGGNGKVTTLVGQRSGADGVVLQADGRIVVAGYADLGGTESTVVAVARYKTDGNLDPEFGEDGVVTTDFGGFYDHAYAVIVQRDHKLVVAGSAGTLPDTDFMLARYNDDGTMDLAFGDGGKVTTDLFGLDDFAHALVQQPDGKLVVAGVANPTGSEYDFALARYTSAGELDTAFGLDGLAVTKVGYSDYCFAVALQRDGCIVVAGKGEDDFALIRYLNDTLGVFRTWLPILTKQR